MTTTTINPAAIAPPIGPYSHGVLTSGPGQWLHVAGQIGVAPDGRIAPDFAEQAHLAWVNLSAILRQAGMDASHLVKVVTYLTDTSQLAVLGPIRAHYLGDARPASTLVVVAALARPEWLVEVDAVAFKA